MLMCNDQKRNSNYGIKQKKGCLIALDSVLVWSFLQSATVGSLWPLQFHVNPFANSSVPNLGLAFATRGSAAGGHLVFLRSEVGDGKGGGRGA